MKTRRFLTTLWVFTLALNLAWAQGPNDSKKYYQAADGKKGAALKTALCGIIYNRTERSYNDLWTDFRTTDKRPTDGKVWDMYSGITNYTFGTDQAGNYSQEGDKYNREHSFPKSWFGDNTPMYTDLFHLYPTDGFVNGKRSNYPFGETSSPTYTSAGSFSKLGPCSYPGYTGTVFEPNDLYKGDFARTYFYMVTCYEEKIVDWYNSYSESRPTLDGNKYPGLSSWQLSMLMKWAKSDQVSAKETNRNTAVYGIQKNRNPFIDYPGLEKYIWGDWQDVAFSYDNYVNPYNGDTPPVTVATPIFSPAAGTYTSAQTVTISCSTSGATIYYTTDGSTPSASSSVYSSAITVSETTTLKALAMKDGTSSSVAEATYTISSGGDPTPSYSIIWEEDWTGASTNASVESINNSSATYIGDGGTNCKIYNESLAGGTAPELLIPKSSREIHQFSATITLNGASGELPLSFKCNKAISVTTSTSGVTIVAGDVSDKIYNYTVNVPSGINTLVIVFATKTNENARIDDIKLVSVNQEESLPGDVVKDGKVTFADLKALVKILLGIDASGDGDIDEDAADVNGDGKTNIADVTKLVNILLSE